MARMESVLARQRGAFEFEDHYDNLCALQSSCPLVAVKVHLREGVLDINGDRIRATDWVPILNTLRINKTLKHVAFRSYFQHLLDDVAMGGNRAKVLKLQKVPAIRSKEITYRLCQALKECLKVSHAIEYVELQGLPLRERDIKVLSEGLMKTHSLVHLSVEYCTIGDSGLHILCQGVKNSPTVASVNFTGMGLTAKGAECIAKVIKHQSMKRHSEAWQDSLRARRPELDRMPGLRRITINCNPMIGDEGAEVIAEALQDDLWLKALDMQQCGISTPGAKALLDVLTNNTTIVVLDTRNNPLISRQVMQRIMEQVVINSNGEDNEYKWIKVEPPQDPATKKTKKSKKNKLLGSSYGQKTVIKVQKTKKKQGAEEKIKLGPGMPWRTAQRATRYRGYPPDTPGKHESFEHSPAASPQQGTQIHFDYSSEEEDTDMGTPPNQKAKLNKSLRVEIEQLRRRFQEESEARSRADKRVLELTVENTRLREEMNQLRARGIGLLDDDNVLDSILTSFQQFHAFLDLLRDAGLGQIVTLAGMDHLPAPFNGVPGLNGKIPPQQGPAQESLPAGQGSRHGDDDVKSDKDARQGRTSKSVKPNILPQNYTSMPDPTMTTEPVEDRAPTKFDELYQKVLEETEGALSQGRGDADTQRIKPGIPLAKKNKDRGDYGLDAEGDRKSGSDSWHSGPNSDNEGQNSVHSGRVTARGEVVQDIDALLGLGPVDTPAETPRSLKDSQSPPTSTKDTEAKDTVREVKGIPSLKELSQISGDDDIEEIIDTGRSSPDDF